MSGRSYAVTGVASGIGAAIAAKLKAQGHQVLGFDLIETDENVDHFIPLDLRESASAQAAAQAVEMPLDGLCNNAGLPPRDGLQAAILQVNFLSQRIFTRAMLPHLKPGSAIVNMASRAGHKWRENLSQIKALGAVQSPADLEAFLKNEMIDPTRAYDLSKEAMILWTIAETEALFPRDLRMISLSPGGVATGILDDFARAFGDRMTRNVARAGRVGEAMEIAEVAAFALSPASRWMKGEDIAIDGGMGAFNLSDSLDLEKLTVLMRGN